MNASVAADRRGKLHQYFVDFEERLTFLHNDLHRVLDEIPEEALDWVPGPDMNSIAVIITHLAASERYWIGDIVAGDPSGRVRDREFEVRNLSTAQLKARLDTGLQYIRTILPSVSVDMLDELQTLPDRDEPHTVGWCLLHVVEHTATHTGHVQLMRQLWEEHYR